MKKIILTVIISLLIIITYKDGTIEKFDREFYMFHSTSGSYTEGTHLFSTGEEGGGYIKTGIYAISLYNRIKKEDERMYCGYRMIPIDNIYINYDCVKKIEGGIEE